MILKSQHAISNFSPVMADANVACLTVAYVAISFATIAVDPYIIAIDIPPLVLRQVVERRAISEKEIVRNTGQRIVGP